ncbi:hypothetical protein Nepgr_027504 [Nepenthes gracilis]|uniref:AAA+ ATPase domain-containing protein n=1 Tax=Nepenthes gracilis TaxID=150966 RepID=A0AAD3TAM0_NEPGR|nr:hypothetical protein Nepgr_027504 [Nepenthes gracilis]
MSGSRVYDPSKLHLKKELTQIRKTARVLRDPGTSSTWKSPLSSARSVPAAYHYHHHHHFDSNKVIPVPNPISPQLLLQRAAEASNHNDDGRGKEKGVFLYNWWTNNKSSCEKSLARVDNLNVNNNDDDDGFSVQGSAATATASACASVSVYDSSSDARNGLGDSKNDTYVYDHHNHHGHRYSTVMKNRDTRLGSLASPTKIRRTAGKKKPRKGSSSSAILKQQHQLQKQKQKRLQHVILDGCSMNSKLRLEGIPSSSLGLSQDDSVSLIDLSDGTEEYYNSEDLRQVSAASPLLPRLRHRNLSHSSAKFLWGSRREDSSYSHSTPALSTSSYTRYVCRRNPSNIGSWDGTTTSSIDVGDEVDELLDFPGRKGCGIPCYWSKRTPKHRGSYGSCCSPSLSDTLRRKGSKFLCGSQTIQKCHRSFPHLNKQIVVSKTLQGHLPLLDKTHGGGGSSLGTGNSDDEILTNFGELDLEGLSRLDGRRWSSSCRSQEGLELMALAGEGEGESVSENNRSLSRRHRPIFFDDLIGQNIVVQSLLNAIAKGKTAPVYIFQGPRGTGKTSTARIFAAALNCLAIEGAKPCGICRECTDFICGKSSDLIEFDGTKKKEIDRVRTILKSLSMVPSSAFPRYKVLVVDECHLLPSKTWLAFLKFLEEPLPRVVFIFIMTDLENVPRTVLSRCQKYLFNKIKDIDIVSRLLKISAEENLDVESDALELIAQNADGSLRDAETMLDQLSLLGKRITASLVNELVGIVPDEKLLDLLELAMTSNTTETVKRARDLMDSGIDPLVLTTQLASLIMDIIAGTNQLRDAKCSNSVSGGRSLTEAELETLKHALKLLSEAEKQLRVSSERSTWFTATLLQLGSVTSQEFTLSGSSRRHSSKSTEEDPSTASRDAPGCMLKSDARYVAYRPTSASLLIEGIQSQVHHVNRLLLMDGVGSDSMTTHSQSVDSVDTTASRDDLEDKNMALSCTNLDSLDDLWLQCIERCHSKTLRQLLHTHGKLVSISKVDGILAAHIAFEDEDIKSRAERFMISITNSIERVLRRNIEVKLVLLPGGAISNSVEQRSGKKQIEPKTAINKEEKAAPRNTMNAASNSRHNPIKVSRGSFDDSKDSNTKIDSVNERRQEIPMQRIESIIRDQRLETAWLQAAEKGTPLSVGFLGSEKNQVVPQNDIYCQNQVETTNSVESHHQDDVVNHETKILKVDKKAHLKDSTGKRVDHHPISPSLLHQSSFAGNLSKEFLGYESGTATGGCNILFCWNTKPQNRGKVKEGSRVQLRQGRRFLCFGERQKLRRIRFRR